MMRLFPTRGSIYQTDQKGTLYLGCAFRLVFRFLPVLIFRNSRYSAEFPEFRGTHVGIKSFQDKINLVRNSGLRNSGQSYGGILCHV